MSNQSLYDNSVTTERSVKGYSEFISLFKNNTQVAFRSSITIYLTFIYPELEKYKDGKQRFQHSEEAEEALQVASLRYLAERVPKVVKVVVPKVVREKRPPPKVIDELDRLSNLNVYELWKPQILDLYQKYGPTKSFREGGWENENEYSCAIKDSLASCIYNL